VAFVGVLVARESLALARAAIKSIETSDAVVK